jgi:hypothetical protein
VALAGGVEDGVADGGRGADHADLAESFDPHRVQQGVWFVDEVDLDGADVGIDGDGIFLEGRVDESAEARIHLAALPQSCADAPNHPAAQLAGRGDRAGDAAAVGHADHSRHADAAGSRFDLYFGEVGYEAEGREARVDRSADRDKAGL